jgi:hypothetical protein
MKTELQKQFEEQTPTLKRDFGVEYLQTFISWLHLQVEKAQAKSKEEEVECSNCKEMVKMISTGEFCPVCMC